MTHALRQVMLGVLLATVSGASGCARNANPGTSITLATTTSTRDSGLLDDLLPRFRAQTGLDVKVVAVGSGQALALGSHGDADVLLTHAPQAEQEFMAAGHGESRRPVMYNDFVLIGPATNPAQLERAAPVTTAFQQIAQTGALFLSRGDQSGTHMKELAIWKAAGVKPNGEWYLEGGSGMAATLRTATEKLAYTLADRGTLRALRQQLDLEILVEGDPLLRNPYAVIVVSASKHPGVNLRGARQFAKFLCTSTTRAAIDQFGIDTFGQALFHALPTE